MRTLLQLLGVPLVVVLALTACAASAQPRPRAAARGLALERVTAETGLTLDELVVPSDPRGAVRLELRDAQSLAALLDVRVLADAAEARARLVSIEPSLSSRGVLSLSGVGDAAYVDEAGTVLALVRGNVLVVVRAVTRESPIEVRAIAAAVVRACDASPLVGAEGTERALREDLVPALQPGANVTLALPSGFVAMRVEVEGEGLARRIDDTHWQIERVARREDVRVIAVDALLRVAR
ncbi:MAG: hypothetical protein J0L92_02940 [Deltaproteobacteria bacterium]|nr:hypothetical protein [Deltaproteobacteria bacterium]